MYIHSLDQLQFIMNALADTLNGPVALKIVAPMKFQVTGRRDKTAGELIEGQVSGTIEDAISDFSNRLVAVPNAAVGINASRNTKANAKDGGWHVVGRIDGLPFETPEGHDRDYAVQVAFPSSHEALIFLGKLPDQEGVRSGAYYLTRPHTLSCGRCGKGINQNAWEQTIQSGKLEITTDSMAQHTLAGRRISEAADASEMRRVQAHPAQCDDSGHQTIKLEWGTPVFRLCHDCNREFIKQIGAFLKIAP